MKNSPFILILIILLIACNAAESVVEPPAATDVPPTQQVQPVVIETEPATAVPVSSVEVLTETPAPTVEQSPTEETVTEVVPEMSPSAEFATSLPIILGAPPVLATSIELAEVATDLGRLVYLTHANDARLFTVSAEGFVYIIENGVVLESPFLDITNRVKDNGEQGFLSIAFHPNYVNNGRFFVYYTAQDDSVIISEFSGNGNQADASNERQLLQVPQPFRNHNGGQLQFGDDGYLYIGLGDGGSGGDPQNHGQNPQTLLGSILRIDVDGEQPYAIPSDNPFVEDDSGADEAWTYGWRNPWRFSFDRMTGDMYVGDVGQSAYEEISFEEANAPGGANYGWNLYEGFHCFVDNCESLLPDAVPPILEYGRDAGCSITGGYVYRGSELPTLNGNYLFSDFCTGTIWASIQPNEFQVVLESGHSVSSFGEDAAGELYVLDISGTVYKIVGAE